MTGKESLRNLKQEILTPNYLTDYEKDECIDVIQQDLERLEKLNNIFSDSHICEIKEKFNEIECNADKCKTCPLGVGDGICLNNVFEHKWKLEEENEKLKQAIEILKDKIELPLENDFDVVNKDDIHLYRLRTKCLINEKEYEILKEVFGNDK